MAPFRILARGDWSSAAIRVRWTASTLRMPPEVDLLVERTWAEALRRPDITLFDGPLCRLEDWQCDQDGLVLTLSRTSYKIFFGTNGRNPQIADTHGPGAMANAVGSSAAVLTADGWLVFGRRSSTMALYPGCAHPFGGCLEPGDDLDVLRDLRRELAEEARLADADITDLRCLALAEDLTLRQPEVMCVATTGLIRSALDGRIEPAEHSGTWAVRSDRDAIATVLAGDDPMTPLTRLMLLLHGARAFGEEWFASAHASITARLA
ncbi:MAG: hypothetical protein H0W83_11775 [Planctomycetes bacterium]|nr:hypothetical protein [Planctomycetota bacterium]